MSARLLPVLIFAATAGAFVAVVSAPTASAIPQCTNTGPTTTQCERPGNAQINTGPSYNNNDYPWGWPFWGSGITISLGGLGI
jgi:hypothetical protein